MEILPKGKKVRLKSSHSSYLHADDGLEIVNLSDSDNSPSTIWAVEHVEGNIRLKGHHGLYLRATHNMLRKGLDTRLEVRQGVPEICDDCDDFVDWHLLWAPSPCDESHVTLTGPFGGLLAANVPDTKPSQSVTVNLKIEEKPVWLVEIMVDSKSEDEEQSSHLPDPGETPTAAVGSSSPQGLNGEILRSRPCAATAEGGGGGGAREGDEAAPRNRRYMPDGKSTSGEH